MAHTGVNYLIPITFYALGDLAVADGIDRYIMDFDAVIWKVTANVGSNGVTGNNDFVIERTPSGGSAGDLWTVAADAGRIAHDSSVLYHSFDWENDAWTGYASGQLYPPTGCRLKKGDTLYLNLNAVATGTAATDLRVTLWVKPLVD